MGGLISVIYEGLVNPATTLLIISICWVWVKIFMQEWDARHFTSSYADVVQRKQYWRVFLAPISHTSLPMLLLNASLLWNVRIIEHKYGFLYFLRYTVLLMTVEATMAFLLIYIFNRIIAQSVIRQIITQFNTLGSSGIILSWLAFQSVTDPMTKNVMFFGYFNIHPALAPLVVISIYYFILPTGYAYVNLGGLLSGYLLASGVLEILPGFYWSACFLLNIIIIISTSILFRDSGAAAIFIPDETDTTGSGNTGDIIEVQEIGPARMGAGYTSTRDLRDILRDSPEESESENDRHSPVLQQRGVVSVFNRNSSSSSDGIGETEETKLEEGEGGDNSSDTGSSSEETPLLQQRSIQASDGPGMRPSYLAHLLEGNTSSSTMRQPATSTTTRTTATTGTTAVTSNRLYSQRSTDTTTAEDAV